jgi:hypothetical protein
MSTEIDLFKYLAVDPSTLQLTDQQYYSCYSRQILRNKFTSREIKIQQITMLRYFSTVKSNHIANTKKLYGDGDLCTAGVWCNRDYTQDLIAKKGLCNSCFEILFAKLKKTSEKQLLCSFCGIAKGPETCNDCSEMLSML